jgi:hypothetical protein
MLAATPLTFETSSNQTQEKNFQTCYTTVINTMSASNPMLKFLLKTPPIQSFKSEVIQNMTQPVHLKMYGQENTAVDLFVRQVAGCMRLLK